MIINPTTLDPEVSMLEENLGSIVQITSAVLDSLLNITPANSQRFGLERIP